MPDAAVIIPHYNDVLWLMRCLAALTPQLTPQVEVVVVDNGSPDSLASVIATYPDLRIIVETRKSAACARNRGVAETTAPLLFFLDCDCVPAAEWLANAFRLNPTADLVGGRVNVFDETPPPRNGAQAFEAVFAFDNRTYVERKGFSVTANLLTRRDVFEAVGDFTPGLSEDLDWCHRATAKGYRLIYANDLQVSHPSRGDWQTLSVKWQRLTQEGFKVNGTGTSARILWALKALIMPVSILVHTPHILRNSKLNNVNERWAAFTTLVWLRALRGAWMIQQSVGVQI